MPVYDYVCIACATRIEVMHGVNEAGPAVCMACGGALRKAMSSPAIVFRGSGWAKKDARPARPGAGGDRDSGAAKDSSSENNAATSSDGAKSESGGPATDGATG
jgi:putative FmdB family regulatory protein